MYMALQRTIMDELQNKSLKISDFIIRLQQLLD